MDLLSAEYLPYFLVALLAGAILAFLLFRPRQRVRLSEIQPLRPHMAARKAADQSGSAQPTSVTPQTIQTPAAPESVDDFQLMKGVGAKFAETLRANGYLRFEQLAALSEEDIVRLDETLGSFKGRLVRDRIPEQSRFLATNDLEGFQRQFGKLQNQSPGT